MAPSSPKSFTDPFSAVYKAHPGQLPSFFSIENYQLVRKSLDDGQNQTKSAKPNTSLQAFDTLDPEDNSNDSALNPSKVFSPSLAGERDRLIRRRMLSNPEHLPMPGSISLLTSASESSPSKMANPGLLSPESLPFDCDCDCVIVDDDNDNDDDEEDDTNDHSRDDLSWTNLDSSDENDDDEEKEKVTPSQIQVQFKTNAMSHHPTQRFPIPTRSSIFFSPPKPVQIVDQSHHTDSERDLKHMHKTKDHKSVDNCGDLDTFSTIFSHAILSGDTVIDLDNQKIHAIPDLSHLIQNHLSALGHLRDRESEKVTALVERMTNLFISSSFSNRQTMTRTRSAPLVSFSSNKVFSLILSNNYLNSNFSNMQRIGHLQGLVVLSLRANFLTEIPHEFGDLKNLEVLNLSNNLLSFLPSSILKLKNCHFFLNGNPWLKPSSTDRSGRKFEWISKTKQVFYLRSPDVNPLDSLQRSIPSLKESCIRKLCITKDSITGEERVLGHQSSAIDHNQLTNNLSHSHLNHSSSSNSRRPTLLPKVMKKILSNPSKNFYRCELCKKRLILNCNNESLIDGCNDRIFDQDHHNVNEFFQFKELNQRNGRQINPHSNNSPDHQVQDGEECENLELNDSIPIRWIACSFDCCVKKLIKD